MTLMKRRRGAMLVVGVAVLLASGTVRASSPVIDDVNGSEFPGFFTFFPDTVGWFYEAPFEYDLDGITSTFRPVSGVTTRTVTLSIWDDVPDDGGNLLRTGTFSAGAAGGDLGIMFAPLELEAGESIFIGLENIAGLGLNIVDFAVSLPPPDFEPNPAIDFLDGWYTGVDFDTFNSLESSPGFAAPILRFHGVVPEPSSVVLALTALALGAFVTIRRRRNT